MVEICKNYILFLKYIETLNLVGELGNLFMQIFQVHSLPVNKVARTMCCVSGLCHAQRCSGSATPDARDSSRRIHLLGINVPRLLLWGKWPGCPAKMGESRKQETVLWGFWSLYEIWNVRKHEGHPSRRRQAAVHLAYSSLVVVAWAA